MRWLNTLRKTLNSALSVLMVTCAWASGSARQQDASTGAANAGSSSTAAHHTTGKSSSTAAKSNTTAPKSSKTHAASAKRSSRKKSVRARGQQKIDSDRAREIQEALIREHYLTGEPTGTWNQASEDAMRHYQEDHGWQTKEVPDSRALIKLGLGPSKDHLLNPESAMTTVPDAPHSDTSVPASHTSPPVSSTPVQTPAQNDPPSPQ